jgi:hypothetical protein|nr:MAG TPA: hypothetical protein [Caudoviricetes sp.]DAI67789.1 MAG TPA: hypothetical protein [Caudoviricetes sp.]DAZ70984.1 MAG TPA: hypothetical protein [Caudoviricetes sp.]
MSNMSNDEIKALAEIFALCYKATNSRNDADLGSAMVFPFRYATQYVRKLHMLGKATPELEDRIRKAYDRVHYVPDDMSKGVPTSQQGVWMQEFYRVKFENAE